MAMAFQAAPSEPVLGMFLAYGVSIHLYYKEHAIKDSISQAPLQKRTEVCQLLACVLWNL